MGGPQITPGLPQGESKDDHEEITMRLWEGGLSWGKGIIISGTWTWILQAINAKYNRTGAKDYQRPVPFATHGSLALVTCKWRRNGNKQPDPPNRPISLPPKPPLNLRNPAASPKPSKLMRISNPVMIFSPVDM